jgi:hypothetical protein
MARGSGSLELRGNGDLTKRKSQPLHVGSPYSANLLRAKSQAGLQSNRRAAMAYTVGDVAGPKLMGWPTTVTRFALRKLRPTTTTCSCLQQVNFDSGTIVMTCAGSCFVARGPCRAPALAGIDSAGSCTGRTETRRNLALP